VKNHIQTERRLQILTMMSCAKNSNGRERDETGNQRETEWGPSSRLLFG